MKKAFTLIELLVVIGIIGILAGVLMGTFSGGTASARAASCLSNMRNLAAACQSYGMKVGTYPSAGSVETMKLVMRNGDTQERYNEHPGWISWNSRGTYESAPSSPTAQAGWNCSTYDGDLQARDYCVTNGALWKFLSGNREVYRCPTHKQKGMNPNWSYVMNAYFGWTPNPGTDVSDATSHIGVEYGSLKRSDRILLFAEIPFAGLDGIQPAVSAAAGTECDSVLQYKNCEGGAKAETIGFNHQVGKFLYGHVAFADGHVEKLLNPGLNVSQIEDLTMWLCTGYKDPTASKKIQIDVSFDGKEYTAIEN